MTINTNIFVNSNEEAKLSIINMLSSETNIDKTIINNAITLVTTDDKALSDGETIYIIHKQTKINKDKPVYVYVADWMF